MTLNNWVQGRFGKADDLTSEELLTGPRHAATWVVIVYCEWDVQICRLGLTRQLCIPTAVRGIEYGRGTSTKKNAAKDQAAERALAALQERFDQEQQ